MADILNISAAKRDRVGKGSARAARREGYVPSVLYGDNQDPISFTLEQRDVVKNYHTGRMFTTMFDIEIDGTKHRALARDIQLHPVTDLPQHVDFLRVSARTVISVDIPLHTINEEDCDGLNKGGVLNMISYTISISCKATNIPESIEIDLKGMDIGDALTVADLPFPDGAKPNDDADTTVLTIAQPAAEEPDEDPDPEEATGETQEAAAEAGGEGDDAEKSDEKKED